MRLRVPALALACLAWIVQPCRAHRETQHLLRIPDEHQDYDTALRFGDVAGAKGGGQNNSLAVLLRILDSAAGFNPGVGSRFALRSTPFSAGQDHANSRTRGVNMGYVYTRNRTRLKQFEFLAFTESPFVVEDALQAVLPLENVVEYNMVLSGFARARQPKRALEYLDHMKAVGLKPDVYSYGSVIHACKEGHYEESQALLEEMVKSNVDPNSYTMSGFFASGSKTNQWEKVLEQIDGYRKNTVWVDDYIFQHAISCCGTGMQWERAVQLLSDMKDDRVRPSEHTYNLVVQICGKSSRWQNAVSLIEQMTSQKPSTLVSPMTYRAAIKACEDGRKPHLAALLNEDLVRSQWVKNPRTMKSEAPSEMKWTMEECARRGEWEETLELLLHHNFRGVNPKKATYHTCFRALEDAGQWQQALFLLFKMQWAEHDHPDADEDMFNYVMRACNKKKKWQQVLSLFNLMHQSRISQDAATFSVAISACENSGNQDTAMSVLLSHCQNSGDKAKADMLRERMRQDGLRPREGIRSDDRLGFQYLT